MATNQSFLLINVGDEKGPPFSMAAVHPRQARARAGTGDLLWIQRIAHGGRPHHLPQIVSIEFNAAKRRRSRDASLNHARGGAGRVNRDRGYAG